MATNQEQAVNLVNAVTNQINRNNSTNISFAGSSKRNVCRIISIHLICFSIYNISCLFLIGSHQDG